MPNGATATIIGHLTRDPESKSVGNDDMKTQLRSCFAFFLVGLVALTAFDASAAVAPHSEESMMKGATHVTTGKVVALSSKTQKSKVESTLFARDRIFKVTMILSEVEKGKAIKPGDELTFEAWQPSTRLPLLPGPQGHQPIPGRGDLVKVYLLYNANSKTYHPYMPNGIRILREAN